MMHPEHSRKLVATLTVLLLLGFQPAADAQQSIRSSIEYTKGTQAMERGDYEQAAMELAEAVRLDPLLSRNQTNYAAALFELGRYADGWPHARKGVLLDPTNVQAQNNSRRYIKQLLADAGLNTGAPLEQIVEVLGEPDGVRQQGECLFYRYGISALCFQNGIFKSIGNLQWKPRN